MKIDPALIEQAHLSRGENAVMTALKVYIQRLKQRRIVKDFGTVDFDPRYDYKAERRRKRNG